jgi:hypothetical protein
MTVSFDMWFGSPHFIGIAMPAACIGIGSIKCIALVTSLSLR